MLRSKFISTYRESFPIKLHRAPLMLSQHWFRYCPCTKPLYEPFSIPDICRHMASLYNNELTYWCLSNRGHSQMKSPWWKLVHYAVDVTVLCFNGSIYKKQAFIEVIDWHQTGKAITLGNYNSVQIRICAVAGSNTFSPNIPHIWMEYMWLRHDANFLMIFVYTCKTAPKYT